MKKTGRLVIVAALAICVAGAPRASSQAPAQPVQPQKPVQPDAPPPNTTMRAATKKSAAATAHTYDRTLLHPALLKSEAPAEFQVKFTTTKGDFTVSVTRAWAPLGADRFYNLVKHHFFDDASFFN